MTCNGCIHYDGRNKFKDKNEYIKLPCKVGDTVYVVTKKEIFKSTVINFAFYKGKVLAIVKRKQGSVFYEDYFSVENIYLSKAEAENKLREHNNG